MPVPVLMPLQLLLLLLLLLLLMLHPGDCGGDGGGGKRAKKASKRAGLSESEAAGCARVQFMLGDVSCEQFLAEVWVAPRRRPASLSLRARLSDALLHWAVAAAAVAAAALGDPAAAHPCDLSGGGASLPERGPAALAAVLADEGERGARVRVPCLRPPPLLPPPLSALRVSLLRGVVRRQVIFIRPDTFVHDERYTHGSAVSPSTVNDALRHGNTLLVHNLEIYWKPIGACRAIACAGRLPNVSCRRSPHARAGVFSEALSSFMNLYAQVNLYYSPPGFPGTVSLHQDAQVGGCSCACPAC
jgi:hypothetical protein